ncbi:MAG TPA: hypothetical protein PLM71_02080 [Syntrophorhabdaceae bacterium]|nr:hypothetical protein [Syntrophorhabdaceae bacterium]
MDAGEEGPMDINHKNLTARICPPLIFFLLTLLLIMPPISIGLDCNNPPRGFGGSWARAYKQWCESCGGTYSSRGPSCTPGPKWGGVQRGTGVPSYDYEAERQRQIEEERRRLEAERQRQQELEEQRRREEEAAKLRQEQFERNKQEALRSMKDIAEGELGLKGAEAGALGLKDIGDTGTGSLGLKDITTSARADHPQKAECEWGNLGASVVDIRCLGLDPDKPISVDPNITKGKERVFPAQIDPKTFENANYNKGFETLMSFDAASAAIAVEYFKKAQKERPKDPLVRNGLLLAQDIYKARLKKEQEKNDQARATYFTLQSYAAMMMGDMEKAKDYITEARKLDPENNNTKFVESLAKMDLALKGTYPARRDAYRLVANSLVSINRYGDLAVAEVMLESARGLQPEDKFIDMFLQELRNYRAGLVPATTKNKKTP